MTAAELADIKDRHRLTYAEMAERLGSTERTMRRYCAGGSRIPESVALLALAMDRKGKRK